LPELEREQVCSETRPAAIAVRKRMDGDEIVMETNRDLIGRKGLVFHPIARIIERLAECRF